MKSFRKWISRDSMMKSHDRNSSSWNLLLMPNSIAGRWWIWHDELDLQIQIHPQNYSWFIMVFSPIAFRLFPFHDVERFMIEISSYLALDSFLIFWKIQRILHAWIWSYCVEIHSLNPIVFQIVKNIIWRNQHKSINWSIWIN